MGVIPLPTGSVPPKGFAGAWANMEEKNSFTGIAGSSFGFGVPLMKGASDDLVVPLTTGNKFVGISLCNIDTSGTAASNGDQRYGIGDILGVGDMGVMFVTAGGTITKGNNVFYNPADQRYYGASATGYLPLPDCEFDASAVAGEVVELRMRRSYGNAAVTAAT